ncbi:MAG: hypothetical protein K2P93_05810 [Alphaproteobacteria bacterium]|nr:hypothetical protein [Alphaproteobacteria bacterium]
MKKYLSLLTISFLSTSSLLEAVRLDFEDLPSVPVLKAKLERKKSFLKHGQYPGRPLQLLANERYTNGVRLKVSALSSIIKSKESALAGTPVKIALRASRTYEEGRTFIARARELTDCPKPVVNIQTLAFHERAQLAKKLQIILQDHSFYEDSSEIGRIEYIDPIQSERLKEIVALLLKQNHAIKGERETDNDRICTHQAFLDMLFQTYDLVSQQQAVVDKLSEPSLASQSAPSIDSGAVIESHLTTLRKLKDRYAGIFLFDRLQRISGEKSLPFAILTSLGSKDPAHRKEIVESHPFYGLLSARHKNEVMSHLFGHDLTPFPITLIDRRVVGEAPNLESLKGNVFEIDVPLPSYSGEPALGVCSSSSPQDLDELIISRPLEPRHMGGLTAAFHRYTAYPNENSLCTVLQMPRRTLLGKIKEEGEKEGSDARDIRNALMAPILARKVSDVSRVDYRTPLLIGDDVMLEDFREYLDHLLTSREPLPTQIVHAYANSTNRTINLWMGSYQSTSRQLILVHNCKNEGERRPIHLFYNNGQYQRLLPLDAPGLEKKRMELMQQRSFEVWQTTPDSSLIDERNLFLAEDDIGHFSDILEQPRFLLVDSFNPFFETDPGNPLPRGYKQEPDPSQPGRTWGFLEAFSEEPGELTLRGDGYVFYYDLMKEEIAPFHGKSFAFEVDVWSNMKGPYCQFWDYPHFLKTVSDPHSGNSTWEKLAIDFTVNAARSRFLFYPIIVPSAKDKLEPPMIKVKGANIREIEKAKYSVPMFPLIFNYSFITIRPSEIPQGYSFVQDPDEMAKTQWGPISVSRVQTEHAKITGDGYVFYHPLSKDEIIKLSGQRLRFTAEILSNTPGAYIQYWDFPNPDKTKSKPYSQIGSWETLTIEFVVNQRQSQYLLYPTVMPGIKAPEAESTEAPIVEVRNLRLSYF